MMDRKKLGHRHFLKWVKCTILPNKLNWFFDPSGAARVMPVSAQEQENRSFILDERKPANFFKRCPRRRKKANLVFRVEFKIDQNKTINHHRQGY